MMRYTLFLIPLLVSSCFALKDQQSINQQEGYEAKVFDFKVVFFQNCIIENSKDKLCMREFVEHDSGVINQEHIEKKDINLIVKLASQVAVQVYQDSVNWTNEICKTCDEEILQRFRDAGMIGSSPIGTCLDYFQSPELDAIARANISKK